MVMSVCAVSEYHAGITWQTSNLCLSFLCCSHCFLTA